MKTILITGANGQLGRELQILLERRDDFEMLVTDVDELDITDAAAINDYFASHTIDYVVNCAAYTAVDAAEDNVELCHLLNATAPTLLARACAHYGARMVHISTDYVLGGDGHRPYREDDETHPLGAYGITKLEGERGVIEVLPEAIILRTAWLYSPHGKNFVKTMLKLGRTLDSLRVVVDQVGTPTYALDLAECILAVLSAPQWHAGIYHVSDEGAISWYDFTMAIHRLAGITECQVSPCMTSEYPTRAQRPHYSVLDKSKFKATFGITLPHWEVSLRHCLQRIAQSDSGDQLIPLKISLN